MTRRIKLLSLLLMLSAVPSAMADTDADSGPKVPMADPKKVIAAKLPGIDASTIKEAPIPGVYEVAAGTNIAYVSSDARYLIRGDLVDRDQVVDAQPVLAHQSADPAA